MNVFKPCNILLPKSSVDMTRWAAIACDQHSSDGAYWQAAEAIAKDAPSTLHMVLPEYYLSTDTTARQDAIDRAMKDYLDAELFDTYENAYLYIERTQSDGSVRRGILGAVDLEAYDYHKGASTPIRASEETVAERIPPRVKIREKALLEMPHVMLLIDDFEKTVIEPLAKRTAAFTLLYDFDLMLGGGHIKGYLVDQDTAHAIDFALEALKIKNPFLFAVGDGNHSLATAKACYEKNPSPITRYAMCEVVNIHDPALAFEPIYRVLFGADPTDVIEALKTALPVKDAAHTHTLVCCYGDTQTTVTLGAVSTLTVTDLQNVLDEYLSRHPEIGIDYIHGEKETVALSQQENTVGFRFDGMKKEDLFPAVAADGALVRKTFSMGESADKRYYIECRKIQ
ncbi:MAG: DUF1015 domain-containing protein [Clostridia bacterium]|nr:DUF1015 domain-containing protein [Clostridia bacterium]